MIIILIIYSVEVPAKTTAAVPTTEVTAITKTVATFITLRPWIQVVAVDEPATVLASKTKDPEVGPVINPTELADPRLIS